MKIGIICEGHTDRAVVENLSKGILGIQHSNILALRPEDDYDETDLSNLNANTFGGWTNVRTECISREKIESFLQIEGQDWIIIHLDSLQADEYDVNRPQKNATYSIVLRQRIIDQINLWLENQRLENIVYAIAIEEIEAWVLTIFISSDSTSSANPKRKLKIQLSKENINSQETFENYLRLSEPFSKIRNHQRYKFHERNESLHLFCQELEQRVLPTI